MSNRATNSTNQLLLVLVAVIAAGLIGYFIGSQKSSSDVPAFGQADGQSQSVQRDAKTAAAAIFQLYLSGDTASLDAYEQLINPEEIRLAGFSLDAFKEHNLSGCQINDSQTLVEDRGRGQASVTFYLMGCSAANCSLLIQDFGGKWLVVHDGAKLYPFLPECRSADGRSL